MAKQSSISSLADLPFDILVLIFPYLDARDFLALCATCRALNTDSIRFDNVFWSQAARKTFRVRNRPQIPNWYRLYYRLRTQTRIFTWGQNTRGCLGHKQEHAPVQHVFPRLGPGDRRRGPRVVPQAAGTGSSDRPKEMQSLDELGVIADLQCGGWSTSVLNDKGIVYTVGVLDGERTAGAPGKVHGNLTSLNFPPGFPKPGERYEPTTAIRTFSSGRAHILGLADSGRIWTWYAADRYPLHVKFHALDYAEIADDAEEDLPAVRDVVAGWAKSTAYVTGTGIITWDVIQHFNRPQRAADEAVLDTEVVQNWLPIPRTSYKRPKGRQREPDQATKELGLTVGEVRHWIVLEHFVVFVTDLNKVFASRLSSASGVVFDSFELIGLQSSSSTNSTAVAIDVQGTFRSFAVLKSTGEVLVVNQDYLEAAYRMAFEPTSTDTYGLPVPLRIPALQNKGVIQMAFGDYHYHALHSDGTVTSYGIDSKGCGAFGLGPKGTMQTNPADPAELITAMDFRGSMQNQPGQLSWGANYSLLPHCYFSGRKIWFQPEMYDWLAHISSSGADPQEAKQRYELCMNRQHPRWLGELSELIEQYSTAYREAAGASSGDQNGAECNSFKSPFEKDSSGSADDGLGAHFVLAIAAAGWHSGALVLVNEELEQAVSASCHVRGTSKDSTAYVWENDTFPRVKLSNGDLMPGRIPLTKWIKEPPAEFERLRYTSNANDNLFGVSGWVLDNLTVDA